MERIHCDVANKIVLLILKECNFSNSLYSYCCDYYSISNVDETWGVVVVADKDYVVADMSGGFAFSFALPICFYFVFLLLG